MQAFNSLDPEAALQTLPGHSWSAKDVLAHLAAWEGILLRFHLGGQTFEQATGLSGAQYRLTPFDRVNDHLHARLQGCSLHQAIEMSDNVHAELMQELQAFPAEDLFQPHPSLSVGEAAGVRWIDYIAANTYEHFEEHLAALG
jgi:hypothetical protein